ncbi:MAG TPA: type II secretion system F family protein [Verrucomicrobiae bacterium]|nr:type II secretion system F family protein [Verrucomicrobiae bacterium]
MGAFRYQAVEASGNSVNGVIEAEDRRAALQLLSTRGIFASQIEPAVNGEAKSTATASIRKPSTSKLGGGIRRKEVTAFTRQLSALLGASIPIPQALEGLGEQEDNPAFRALILHISETVRKGSSLSVAMEEHPRVFNKLFVSMVRVGEEAGALPAVMNDLADLLEQEEEIRGEVVSAVAYPIFVLVFGILTVVFLLTFVLPKLFGMLSSMAKTLPLPTVILLNVSGWLHRYWPIALVVVVATVGGIFWYSRNPKGALMIDRIKLRVPLLGSVFLSSALSRFARTLGTLTKAGVSLLPALKIVENTIGNLVLANFVAQVSEETRGGDSLAGPLRKIGIFPKTVIQMIDVGEETGKLPEMLLKIADIQEREMRGRTRTLVSLLAPVMILIVGGLVGFMVIALLLPIMRMSRSM